MRTLLFVPANRQDYFSKLPRFSPDGVIADLEDAVPQAEKDVARQNLSVLGATLRAGNIKFLVRINHTTNMRFDDLEAAISSGADVVVIPKADSVDQIVALDRHAAYLEGKYARSLGSTGMLLIPETAAGIRNLHDLCRASTRVMGTMTPISGPIAGDVARAIGYQPTLDGAEQLYVQSGVILDSRAAGAVRPYAGIIGINLSDHVSVKKMVARARTMGFDGVALIHPAHVEIARNILQPTAAEVTEAQELIAAYEGATNSGRGVVRFRDAMVDLAMVERARDLLQTAGVADDAK